MTYDSIFCDNGYCLKWVHRKCAKLTKKDITELGKSSALYFCPNCKDTLPYNGLDNDEFQCTVQNISENILRLYDQCEHFNFTPFICSDDDYYFDDKIDPDKEFFDSINVNCKYYTESCFVNDISKIDGLSIIHLNCRSIRKKFNTMVDLLQSLKKDFDVIAISETWEDCNDCNNEYVMLGYDSFFISRINKGGGGVAIFAKTNLNAKIIDSASFSINEIIDCVSIQIETIEKKIFVSCIYRPPNRNLTDFISQIECLLQKYRNKTLFIVGDMNINILQYINHEDTNAFLNLMYSNGLYPLITKPTRITEKSATLIDNIFTNECQLITKSGVLICDVSDHLPVFQICRYNSKCENKQTFTYKRSVTEDSINEFVRNLTSRT